MVRGEDDLRDGKADAKLDVAITRLRAKLDKQMIVTVKGQGYRIESERGGKE
jgi:DNA-binding response OmpR family regulator